MFGAIVVWSSASSTVTPKGAWNLWNRCMCSYFCRFAVGLSEPDSVLGAGFSVKMIDFGENRRFHRFGSADGHGIAIKMYVCMLFLSIRG